VETVRIAVVVGVCLLSCEVCRTARLAADAGLPLLKEVRNCVLVARGNLLQRIEAFGVALYPRDSDAACRGSMARIGSSSGADGSGRGSRGRGGMGAGCAYAMYASN
jgi:hypothetical protein